MYRSLDPEAILKETETLHQRITERFPERGITRISAEITQVAREAKERSALIAKPNWWLRFGIGVLIVAIALILFTAARSIRLEINRTFDLETGVPPVH